MAIIDSPKAIKNWTVKRAFGGRKIPQRNKVLMVHPQDYRIEYAINPHMKDAAGKLKNVDTKKALTQWKDLVKAFEKCGLEVDVLGSHAQFPDMVFAANQSFPYWSLTENRPEVLLSNMAHEERKGEVAHFEDYFASHSYQVKKIPDAIDFEGTGDALLDTERKVIFCGYGFRTDATIPARLLETTGYSVIPLELKNPDFYHLDTCLAPLNSTSAVVVKEAFTEEGLALLSAAFENCIYADEREAKIFLAANLFCPNGKDVVLDSGNRKLIHSLEEAWFNVHPVDTSEFLKSGGSVFCLKLFCW